MKKGPFSRHSPFFSLPFIFVHTPRGSSTLTLLFHLTLSCESFTLTITSFKSTLTPSNQLSFGLLLSLVLSVTNSITSRFM